MEETLTAHAHPRLLAVTLATTPITGPHGDTDTAAIAHATTPATAHAVLLALVPTLHTSPSAQLYQ